MFRFTVQVKMFASVFLISLVIAHFVTRFVCPDNSGCPGNEYLWINYVVIGAGTVKRKNLIFL